MRAVSRPLEDVLHAVPDLNDVAGEDGHLFVRDGVGVAGRGVALRVDADHAVDALRGIEHDSTVAEAAPLALGTLPFRPGAPAELIVPTVSVVKRGGRCWVTTVGDTVTDIGAALAPPDPAPPIAPTWRIEPEVDVDRYLAAVATARDAVRDGSLTKAVIARPIRVSADRPIPLLPVLRRLKQTFGSSYRYSVDGMIGASPELLIEVEGAAVRSHPLAGTTRSTGDPAEDRRLAEELRASDKNQIEHRVVIDDLHDRLLPWASYLDWEPEPSIVAVANVQHLATRMEGMLSHPAPDVMELVRAVLPTPALGGHPRAPAIDLIERVEGFERGRYGGAVGWVDANGDGTWAVTIRCAEFTPDRTSARLVAGGGIVAESEPLAELAETQAKFQAMLGAIVRG